MLMLVNCSNCHTPLQLPPGAASIRCAICQAITRIADPRSGPPAPPSSYPPTTPSFFNGYNNSHYPPPPAPAPSPYNHAPPGPPPSAHGRKYRNSRQELKECINDARCMKFMLINRFKFPESSILMLTGVGVMRGKTIVLEQAHGKAQVGEKPYLLVVVMMIKPLLIQLPYLRLLRQAQ